MGGRRMKVNGTLRDCTVWASALKRNDPNLTVHGGGSAFPPKRNVRLMFNGYAIVEHDGGTRRDPTFALWSYNTIIAWFYPAMGAMILNTRKYSVSTSRHQSLAQSIARNLDYVTYEAPSGDEVW